MNQQPITNVLGRSPILQGLTQRHWKQFDDINIIANKEQRILLFIEFLSKSDDEEKFKLFKALIKSMNGNSKQALERFNAECKLAGVE